MTVSDSSADEDEIDLLELIITLLRAWKIILTTTVICTGFAFAYALSSAEVFKAETLLAPAKEENIGSSSALNQFGGLAVMAGITKPINSNIDRVLATLETREFLKKFISERDLLSIIFSEFWDKSSKSWVLMEGQSEFVPEDGISTLKRAIEVQQNDSGLITLSITWKDPKVAARLANELVEQLNQLLREKAISDSKMRVGYLEQELAKTTLQDMRGVLYNLLESEQQKAMLANVNRDFALEVIDPAVVPQNEFKPNRRLIVVIGGITGCFAGIFFVFSFHFIKKLKSSYSET